MPRKPDPLTVAAENRAFLRHLRATGNAHEAARRLGLSRTRFTKRRAQDPGFATKWDAALALADANLAARGEGRLVRAANGRLQLRAAIASTLDRPAEQRFLLALSASANVRLSAKAAGFSPASFYLRRRASPGFAREWRTALEQGFARLEAALLAAGLAGAHEHDDWRRNDPPELPPMTPSQALQLMYLHQKEARLLSEPAHLKRRRGESREAHSFRLTAMHRWGQELEREKFRVAEAEREARGIPRSIPVEEIGLPDLSQVTGWSKADLDKAAYDERMALFGGWRLKNWKEREGEG